MVRRLNDATAQREQAHRTWALCTLMLVSIFSIKLNVAEGVEIYNNLEEWEWDDLGIYELSINTQPADTFYGDQMEPKGSDEARGWTCEDINYRNEISDKNPRKVPFEIKECPDGNSEYDRCIKFVYLNGFPGNTSTVTINGAKLFSGVESGWHLSSAKELPVQNSSKVLTVRATAGGYANERHLSRWAADYYTSENFETYIMEAAQDGMAPFSTEGFFEFYMQLEEIKGFYRQNDLQIKRKPRTPSPSTNLRPTAVPIPAPSPLPSQAPTLSPSTPSPTWSWAPTMTKVPTAPTAAPTSSWPTMVPTFGPSVSPTVELHPFMMAFGDGPFATMWGFNQSKMSERTKEGTVLMITHTVAQNITCPQRHNSDKNCIGQYENQTFYNRSYTIPNNQAIVCMRNASTGYKFPIANASFMELSMVYIPDNEYQYLDGWISVHGLPEIMPTSVPTQSPATSKPSAVPTPYPTAKPTTPSPTTPMPSADTSAPSFPPTPAPTSVPTMTSKPTPSPSVSRVPSSLPTVSQMPTRFDDRHESMCSGVELVKVKASFDWHRIWYVGVTGSYKEDQIWERDHNPDTATQSQKDKWFGTTENDRQDGLRDRDGGGFYDSRNIEYKIEIIDEYGLTSMPTTMPTFSDTPVYIPSDFVTDPFAAGYQNFAIMTLLLFGVSLTIFILTRCFFNAYEVRKTGRWLI